MQASSDSRSRFVTLDGMRGIAPVAVVLFHLGKLYPVWVPSEAYLAVDMFFGLSGFVLARTNDRRFAAGLRWQTFMWRRIIRLYPLYIIGFTLGLIELAVTSGASAAHIAIAAVPNVALLPSVTTIDAPRLFVINGVAWSLFCEFWIANLAYAVFWRHINRRSLSMVIVVSVVALAFVDVHFRSLDVGSLRSTAVGGVVRVAFSFTVGVALWRTYSQYGCRIAAPSWLILFGLALILAFPAGGGHLRTLYDFAVTVAAFPVLIYIGAEAVERRPAIGSLLGDLSYALYVTHLSILEIWAHIFPTSVGWIAFVSSSFVAVAIVSAFALDRYYDPLGRELIESIERQRTV